MYASAETVQTQLCESGGEVGAYPISVQSKGLGGVGNLKITKEVAFTRGIGAVLAVCVIAPMYLTPWAAVVHALYAPSGLWETIGIEESKEEREERPTVSSACFAVALLYVCASNVGGLGGEARARQRTVYRAR